MNDSRLVIDCYVEGLGTVRNCIDCHALVVGGPTRCIRCAAQEDIGPVRRWIAKRLFGLWIPQNKRIGDDDDHR